MKVAGDQGEGLRGGHHREPALPPLHKPILASKGSGMEQALAKTGTNQIKPEPEEWVGAVWAGPCQGRGKREPAQHTPHPLSLATAWASTKGRAGCARPTCQWRVHMGVGGLCEQGRGEAVSKWSQPLPRAAEAHSPQKEPWPTGCSQGTATSTHISWPCSPHCVSTPQPSHAVSHL